MFANHVRPSDGFGEGRRQPGSLPIFLGEISQMGGHDFNPPVPETFAMIDGRMVDGYADGRG
jgi:hypothetical protein